MKIGIDAGCLGIIDKRLQVGVFQVVKNLLIQLGKIDKKNTYLLYSFYPIDKKLLIEFGPRMKNIVIPSLGWLKISLPLRLMYDRPDVFLAANQAVPARPPFAKYKVVSIFYDIAFEKYSELYSYATSVAKHKMISNATAQQSEKIITISESTKKDIQKIYKINSKKTSVAYPGFVRLANAKAYRTKVPYFLFVGAYKKSKNIPFLLKGFEMFVKNAKKDYQLILVGGNKWFDPEIASAILALSKSVRKKIKFFGFVNEKKLASLYKGATALVSPSLYEGFGLPFLEAQSMGCPVIGSTRGSLPEVIEKTGLLVDPINVDELVNAMQLITQNKPLKLQLIKKGRENAKSYSWQYFAKAIQSALEQA